MIRINEFLENITKGLQDKGHCQFILVQQNYPLHMTIGKRKGYSSFKLISELATISVVLKAIILLNIYLHFWGLERIMSNLCNNNQISLSMPSIFVIAAIHPACPFQCYKFIQGNLNHKFKLLQIQQNYCIRILNFSHFTNLLAISLAFKSEQKAKLFQIIYIIGLSVLILSFTPILVLILLCELCKAKRANSEEDIGKNFGCLIEDLKTSSVIGMFWNILILLRWIITITVIVVLREYNSLQMISLLLLSMIFLVLLLQGRPNIKMHYILNLTHKIIYLLVMKALLQQMRDSPCCIQ